jgi:predicted RNA binding protein YcfA (HicA-like mRNA interferase family)
MARLGPTSRTRLIKGLHDLGFNGPFSGGRHLFMERGETIVRIPNPHQSDISADLLSRILRQARVTRREWLNR